MCDCKMWLKEDSLLSVSKKKSYKRKEEDESKTKWENYKRSKNEREARGENIDTKRTTEPMAKFSYPSWSTSYLKMWFLTCLINSSSGRQHVPHLCPQQGFRPEPSMAKSSHLRGHIFGVFQTSWKTAGFNCQNITLFNTVWCRGRSLGPELKCSLLVMGQLWLHPHCVWYSKQCPQS